MQNRQRAEIVVFAGFWFPSVVHLWSESIRLELHAGKQSMKRAEEVKCMSGDRLGRSYPLNSSF